MSDLQGLGLLAAGSLEYTGCQWGNKGEGAYLLDQDVIVTRRAALPTGAQAHVSAEWCCCVLIPTLPQYHSLGGNSADSSALNGKNSKAASTRNLGVGNSDELYFLFSF